MPIWRTRPVDSQSSLTLRSWQVVGLPDGSWHLVGFCAENREGRVSSGVCEFDSRSLRAQTGSGRIYILKGPPGGNLDAKYVWKRWASLNQVADWEDVSAAVWQQHQKVRAKGD